MTDLTYTCQWCLKQGEGMSNFIFVTGKWDVTTCSLWCLVDWVADRYNITREAAHKNIK